jgi:crotonobetainyl-CoA:carnitine CoA-transferase CaiB-like acyl-CoA transferase
MLDGMRPTPLFYQHTKEILLEFGFTEDEFGELKKGGVVR